MLQIPNYMKYYYKLNPILNVDKIPIELIDVKAPFDDVAIMSEWASNFRKKYINDDMLIKLKKSYQNVTPIDLVNNYLYPDLNLKQGKNIRIGDFGEILLAEFLKYSENFWVPSLKFRYRSKAIEKNTSTHGSDIIAIKFINDDHKPSPKDELCIYEVKSGIASTAYSRLKAAISGSDTDDLNYEKKRNGDILKKKLNGSKSVCALMFEFENENSDVEAEEIRRFLNPNDLRYQYKEKYVAAAVVDETKFNKNSVKKVTVKNSIHSDKLGMVTVKVSDMENLINVLYSELGVNKIGN